MSEHGIAQVKNNLSALVDRALAGEEVVITRHGRPVAQLRAIAAEDAGKGLMTDADLDWLAARRATRPQMPVEDAATTVRRMRDEGP